MSESKTPRTDAVDDERASDTNGHEGWKVAYFSMLTFARALETELATWEWVKNSARVNADHAVIVRLENDGNFSFLHGDSTKQLETELSAALQREKDLQEQLEFAHRAEREADKKLTKLSCAFAIERDAKLQAEAELSRYRAAEKALPEEPDYKEAQDFMRSAFVVDRTVYDALRAHAAAVTAERDAMRDDAERYRWLRKTDNPPLMRGGLDLLTLDKLDAAIDAAIKETP